MKMGYSVRKSGGITSRATVLALSVMLAVLADVSGVMATAGAQTPFSNYIPTAVPTATSTLFANGTTAISSGRVAVDKAGNVFYVGHVSGSASTLYEIPAPSTIATISAPTALISGLGQVGSNSAFVDAVGTLWLSNGNGAGASLLEIPAADGIPNTAAITGNSNYGSAGLPLTNITTACTATSATACTWSASGIGSSLTSLQVGDIYSDGSGNVYLIDISDSVSNGAYNRVIQFNTGAAGTITALADRLTSNAYAQVTVAGDGLVYYCDSFTGNSSGGLVSVINSSGSLTTVGNLPSSSLTLLNAIVNVVTNKVPNATGITTDPWGNLIISGPQQLAEIPLENGVLALADQFNLLVAVSGANAPMATNNVIYGGTFDVHGSYYYATTTNIMQVQVGGYNFGKVNVGTEVTTAAPYLNLTWSLPSYLQTSLASTSSPSTLSAANAAYLQSFPFSGAKNYYGGTPYSASNTGQYSLMYFQPVHPGLLMGGIFPQGYSNYMAATDSNAGKDFYMNGAYLANLQGVGVGPQPMFLPGTASKAVTVSQLYTSYSKAAKAVGFTPTGVAIDTFGNIFVTDTTNTSLDLDCLATTANTAQNYRSGVAGNGYANSYCLTNGLADTSVTNLTGSTFKVSATGTTGLTFPTSFVNPVDVVLDGANNAYVLDSASNATTVTKMPFATMIPVAVVPSNMSVAGTLFNNPMGLAIDGYGNLYIADTGNNRIIQGRLYNAQYSQNIVYVSNTVTFGGIMLSGPTGLGLDASGNLFIADTGNRRIVEYSVTGVGSVISTTGVTLTAPTSVKVLPSGALVVADSSIGLVLVNNGSASVLSTGSIKLGSTGGLGLDLAGNIYVADPTGLQVVELNINSPAAVSFSDTLKPDVSGSHTSSETSYIYNIGNATLNFSAAPTTVDNTTSATNEFSVDSSNACLASTTLTPNVNCGLILDFTPSATATVYSPVTGATTVADNIQSYTIIANPASSSQAIGSFGSTGSTQKINLSGYPVVPFTAQTITFTTPITSVMWSSSIPPFTLSATGGPSGQPVIFSILSGPGTLSGPNNSILTVKDIGTTVIAANQAGALANGIYYGAAAQVTQQIVVNPIGTVATPTFSLATGTYTAVQSVTISDSTPGATIYYTTNGNTPTLSSQIYTAGTAIPVNITTTIKAFAVGAPGYANSPVAVAAYTLNPDFILKASVTTLDIPNGLGGSATLTLTPLFGFTGNVVLSCSGLSGKDACSFLKYVNSNQATVASSTLTIPANTTATVYGAVIVQANETASLGHSDRRHFVPVTVLAVTLLFCSFRKRKRLGLVMLVMLSAVGVSMMTGCNSPSTSGNTHSSTFTLTATSGSIVHNITITLNVNNL
ncbi:MAG: chitobiase/beta-hexosaminidase C-terminal domain-containing protein [Acidobacteriaceae bacterium]|nr:chitobiase/beta-hexosaminidase C-terminal domain-containing protein [Acidobacteriaceae bacterium]